MALVALLSATHPLISIFTSMFYFIKFFLNLNLHYYSFILCIGEDLLTECITICKKLNTQCLTKGEADKEDQLKIKRAIWGENDKEICKEMDKYKKVKYQFLKNMLGLSWAKLRTKLAS